MKKIIYVLSFLIFCLWGQSQNNEKFIISIPVNVATSTNNLEKGFPVEEIEIFRVKLQAQRFWISVPVNVATNTTDLPHNPPLIAESSLEFVGNTKATIINFLKSKNEIPVVEDSDSGDQDVIFPKTFGFAIYLWKDDEALHRIGMVKKEPPRFDYLLSKKFQLMPGALFPDHLYKWTPTENIPYRFYYSNSIDYKDFKTKQQMQAIDKKTLTGTFVFSVVSKEGIFVDDLLSVQVKNGIIQRIDYGSSE